MSFCFQRPRRTAGIVGCVVLLAMSGLQAGCGSGSSASRPADPTAGPPSLARVSRFLIINDLELRFDCSLAYGVPADTVSAGDASADPSLLATVRMIETRGKALPPELVPDHVWVFHGRGIWSSALVAEPSPVLGPNQISRMAQGGPALQDGQRVAISVRVRVPGGEDRFVRIEDVRIGPNR